VDIDFPVVYRALAGLEALAQAAGRCNRSMKLAKPGQFIVYRAGKREEGCDEIRESKPPQGMPRLGMEVALTEYFAHGLPDLHNPELFPAYSRRVLAIRDLDVPGIRTLEAAWDFEEVAARFRMIDDEARLSVVAPYGDAPQRILELRDGGPTRESFRALQRYTVSIRQPVFDALFRSGWIEPVMPSDATQDTTLWCVREGDPSPYDERFGFANREAEVRLRPLQV